MAYRSPSEETWNRARDDYLAGATVDEVCARYSISRPNFFRHRKLKGWCRMDQDDPEPTDFDEAELIGTDAVDDEVLMLDLRRRMILCLQSGRTSEAMRLARMRDMIRRHAESVEGREARRARHQNREALDLLRDLTAGARTIEAHAAAAHATARAIDRGGFADTASGRQSGAEVDSVDSFSDTPPPPSRADRRRQAHEARKRR